MSLLSPDISQEPLNKENNIRLLLLGSHLDPSSREIVEINRILEEDLEWDWIEAKAEEEGTGRLLYWNLRYFPQSSLKALLERLKIRYLRNIAANARTYRTLEPFLEAVRQSEVRAALTKGARLALTVYPDMGLRSFGDVDCIVHPHDWPHLKTILKDLDFREAAVVPDRLDPSNPNLRWTYSPYFRKGDLLLEIQFTYLGLHFPFGSEEDFWETSQSIPLRKTELRILSPEYELCYLCLHAQQHSYQKLMWMADIAALLSRETLDWSKVSRICREEKIKASVFYGLHLVNVLWPKTVPAHILEGLSPTYLLRMGLRFLWPESQVSDRRATDAWPYYMPSVFSLWERKNPLLAIRTLASILFPPWDWISFVTGGSGRQHRILPYYFERMTRPFELVIRRWIGK